MNNKELENKIASAVNSMVPHDTFEKVCEKISLASGTERKIIKMTNRKNRIVKIVGSAVAACLILVVGLFGGAYYSNNIAVDSVIDIDVNPGIEITTNKSDRVIDVEAVSDDAIEVLDGMDLKKSDLKVAVNAIIGSMVKKGYVVDENSGILVTVQNKSSTKAEQIRNEIVLDIDESLSQYKIDAPVINQTLTDFESAEKFAKDNKISLGKAVFINNLAAKDSSLDRTKLAKMSIKELAKVVNDNKIDISDIADYDSDDSIWENISESIEEVNEDAYEKESNKNNNSSEKPSTEKEDNKANVSSSKPSESTVIGSQNKPAGESSPEPAVITAEKAKGIALSHAGVKAADARFEKAELDYDDGVKKYEIEFRSGKIEYDYEINAITGAVLSAEKDIDDDDDKKVTSSSKVSSSESTSSGDTITVKKAKEIALSHAGVKAADVRFEKAELDRDDGVKKYEIEFRSGNVDYEYEINAETGKIISHEKDVDDDHDDDDYDD